MKALVTGAAGYVGSAIVRMLAADPRWEVRGAVRQVLAAPVTNCEYAVVGDLGRNAELGAAVRGCDVIVHTAARVHVMHEAADSAAAAYRQTNVTGTLNLAREAARCGVRRFVFISTVKVHGESSRPGRAICEQDPPHPQGPYALSKWEAESALREVCAQTGMECVIVRPPLVYGAGAGANFLSLAQAVKRGLPLPLATIHNHRSLIAIDNLVDFLRLCMDHPFSVNETFLVSDGHDLSTPELVRGMAAALNRPARLWALPCWVLRTGGLLTGRLPAVQRLTENLQVDIRKARQLLSWNPAVTVHEGLRRAMQGLRE